MNEETSAKKTGFAAIAATDPERHRELSSRGGRTSQANGNAHRFTSETARAAAAKSLECGNRNQWTSETARAAAKLPRKRKVMS